MQGHLAEIMGRHASAGRIDWIGLRPERLGDMVSASHAVLNEDGLQGDHARPGKRAVTLIQAEHLPIIAALAGGAQITAALLRRNIVVSGINLTALRNHPLQLGGAVVKMTAPCAPCSRMEAAIGSGGYNAMRSHGGWCATVLTPGEVSVRDEVKRMHLDAVEQAHS